MRLDLDRERAQDVLVEAHLALHLLDGRRRGIDVHEREVRLAVLLDAVGQGLQTPVLRPAHGAAVLGDHGRVRFDELVDSLSRHILTDEEHGFVKWQITSSTSGRTRHPPHRPSMRLRRRQASSKPLEADRLREQGHGKTALVA